MDLLKDILRQYWLQILALLVLIAAVIRYWYLGDCLEVQRLRLMLLAAAGFVATVASEEFSEWTGHYGLTRSQWYTAPEWYIRFVGGLALVFCTVGLYRL
jgi:hypothetical protein